MTTPVAGGAAHVLQLLAGGLASFPLQTTEEVFRRGQPGDVAAQRQVGLRRQTLVDVTIADNLLS